MGEPGERRGATLLLCEDSDAVRGVLRSVLADNGYTVIEARSGDQAVQLSRDHAGAFRLLITDVVMPGMMGDELAEAVWKDQPEVRVLFTSGHALDALRMGSVQGKHLDFIQKPFSPQDLLQRVRKILDDER